MASLGKTEELNPQNININHYLDCLKQYFVAKVEVESSESHRHHAIFISVIGWKTYDILADLCLPDSQELVSQLFLCTP